MYIHQLQSNTRVKYCNSAYLASTVSIKLYPVQKIILVRNEPTNNWLGCLQANALTV